MDCEFVSCSLSLSSTASSTSPVRGCPPSLVRTLSSNTSSSSTSSSVSTFENNAHPNVPDNHNSASCNNSTNANDSTTTTAAAATMMTMISPKKQKTARKELNFFDSPRKAIFGSPRTAPKKKSRHPPPSPSLQPEQPQPQHYHQQSYKTTPPRTPLPAPITTLQQQQQSIHTTNDRNVLTWLHDEAPRDILPKILSYAGVTKSNPFR